METKEKILKHIKRYKADDLKMLYVLMSKILLGNNDFRLAAYANKDDLRPIIEEETEEMIDFPMDAIIGIDELEIWKKIESIEMSGTKMKKLERAEMIASVMSSDTLFEGFCLAFYGTDEELEMLCTDYGCMERLQMLVKDSVYQKRRNYMQLIARYAKAAVHLYGVIYLVEFEEILKDYEKSIHDYRGYERETGSYQRTVMFQPRYLGLCTLQHLIGDAVPTILTTMDALLVHSCFLDDFLQEKDEMLQFFSSKKREIEEKDLDEFFSDVSERTSYRRLLAETLDKPFYIPSKKEFLRYADENYYEISSAEEQLRRYIEKNYLQNFARVADKVGISTKECVDDFLMEIRNQATDVGKCGEERDPNELFQFAVASLEGYGIPISDIQQVNEFLGYVMNIANSVRLWVNHGNTAIELMRQTPPNLEDLRIVPGSSHAAQLLSEGREGLEQMGLTIDLDGTATEIPTLAFNNGINGKSQRGVKKVYPNDPCPCGSGKKFKKCCGRR